MREYIETNIKIIKKHLNRRKKIVSRLNKKSILEEYKEWNLDPMREEEFIWTLPDLTCDVRLNNFCRSIRKEIR